MRPIQKIIKTTIQLEQNDIIYNRSTQELKFRLIGNVAKQDGHQKGNVANSCRTESTHFGVWLLICLFLQKNCNQHFDEEEKNILPLMEASNLSENQQRKIINQCIDVMQGTHSHLFRFFIEGLLPHESMEYLDVIGSCIDKEQLASLLHLLVE